MEHVRSRGYPVPAVHEASGPDLVLERAVGPTMTTALARSPWTLGRQADLLADLHTRLHAIDAPAGLRRPFGPGDALLHLDLHPENVILTASGPMVIDWANAAAGPAAADVALSWVIMATSDLSALGRKARLVALLRRAFVRRFLTRAGKQDARAHLAAACEARIRDPNVTDAERERVRALARVSE